ncbi:MAG: methionyl-tRNA formyltransferase [bacterium]|jgi:methionyl-tRNA formyltransferase
MRIAFAGTPAFAVPSLRALLDSGHEVVCVITQPDRPAGRGLSLRSPPVKKFAEANGLKIYQPPKFNRREFLDELESLGPDLIITAAYGRIFKSRSLGLPSRGCVNLHASLLPRYRGVAPINWAVINGETQTGVTTFFMEKGVDTGEMIVQKKTAIGENETAGELYERLADLGAGAVVETCDLIARGEAPRLSQDDSLATYAPKLTRDDAEIAWDRPARTVHNHIRGVNPWPGAFTRFRGGTVKILESRLGPLAIPGMAGGGGAGGGPEPGTILDIQDENGILLACGDGCVWLLTVQAAGRKPAGGAAFSRGARLKRGEHFA